MLYWLTELAGELSIFNVFRYITFRTGGALITALLFVFLFGPRIIRSLRVRQGKGQPIRKDGPERHLLQKQGTPTMGGLMILSGLTFATLLWGNLRNPYVWVVLLVTLVYGAVGLYDDYLKVTKQSAAGFRGRIKIVIEAVVALIATAVIVHVGEEPLSAALAIPFFKNVLIPLGWLFIPVGAFIIVGAGNAVNLTDGLDGPCHRAGDDRRRHLRLYLLISSAMRCSPNICRSISCKGPASWRWSAGRWSARGSASCGSTRRPR